MKREERYKYLRITKPRYQEARSHRGKTRLLDEYGTMEQVIGLHQKHLIDLALFSFSVLFCKKDRLEYTLGLIIF